MRLLVLLLLLTSLGGCVPHHHGHHHHAVRVDRPHWETVTRTAPSVKPATRLWQRQLPPGRHAPAGMLIHPPPRRWR